MESVSPSEHRHAEFVRLLVRDRDRLFSYIYSLVPNHADAEDIFQRTSVLLWQKFDQYEPDRSFLAWACGVAFYEVRNFLRCSARDRLYFDPDLVTQLAEDRAAALADGDRRLAALERCLNQLRSHDRQIVDEAYRSGQSLKEFAAASGQALQTLYNRLSIVRRRLLECVERRLRAEGSGA